MYSCKGAHVFSPSAQQLINHCSVQDVLCKVVFVTLQLQPLDLIERHHLDAEQREVSLRTSQSHM
jgi:hypothetical protein